MTRVRLGVKSIAVFAIVLGVGLPALADELARPAPANTQQSIETPAAPNATGIQAAQFQLPQATPKGQTAAPPLSKALEFEYVYGSELEIPYTRDADLNRGLRDDSLRFAPTVFGSVTYRPTDWLETKLETTLEKLIAVHEEDLVTLPNGTTQKPDPAAWSLLIDQAYFTLKPASLPFELTLGRRNFEDRRLWLYDAALDAAILTFKPGDFAIEASVSREDLVDLDFITSIQTTRTNNYITYVEYRGVEDHQFGGYWILRDDRTGVDGQPQFWGLRAQGRPADAFNYWTELATVRGSDENSLELEGYAIDVGGTYRFLDLPLQPSVTLGYAFGTGDGDPNDTKNTAYRQTGLNSNEGRFGGVTQFATYGEALAPELSNMHIITAGAAFRPLASMFVDVVYHYYRFDQIAEGLRGSNITAEANQIAGMESREIGSEVDLIVGFRNLLGIRGLGFEVRAGVFFPGDAFLREDNGIIFDPDPAASVLGVFFY